MNTYILILTLAYIHGDSGSGGIAMQEFSSRVTCEAAGQTWQDNLRRNTKYVANSAYYVCTKK